MKDEVYRFVIDSLRDMNYSVAGVDENTTLGPAGVDLESLAIAELGVRVEDRFGVRFADEEADEMASYTVGEFAEVVTARYELAHANGGARQ
jgi:acyl carrier protein